MIGNVGSHGRGHGHSHSHSHSNSKVKYNKQGQRTVTKMYFGKPRTIVLDDINKDSKFNVINVNGTSTVSKVNNKYDSICKWDDDCWTIGCPYKHPKGRTSLVIVNICHICFCSFSLSDDTMKLV